MALNFTFPLSDKFKKISSGFGWRWIFGKWGFHGGNDHPCPNGTPVRAPYDGFVISIRKGPRAGIILELDHPSTGDVQTVYYHLKRVTVYFGQAVKQGDIIAETDNTGLWTTGPHAHLGLKVNGKWTDPSKVWL